MNPNILIELKLCEFQLNPPTKRDSIQILRRFEPATHRVNPWTEWGAGSTHCKLDTNGPSLIFSFIGATSSLPLMHAFPTLSFSVAPHVHLNICIYVTVTFPQHLSSLAHPSTQCSIAHNSCLLGNAPFINVTFFFFLKICHILLSYKVTNTTPGCLNLSFIATVLVLATSTNFDIHLVLQLHLVSKCLTFYHCQSDRTTKSKAFSYSLLYKIKIIAHFHMLLLFDWSTIHWQETYKEIMQIVSSKVSAMDSPKKKPNDS